MKDHKPYFRKAVAKFYPDKSSALLTEIDKAFEALHGDISFAATSKNPMDRRLDVAGYFLAMIISLDKRGESFEDIRRISLDIAHDYVRPQNRFQAYLKKLPVKMMQSGLFKILISYFAKRVGERAHPDGFVTKIITDKNETFGLGYGFDILECGICKLYEKNNYKRFASILCEVDNITSSLAGLKLIRSGTIANGAKKCDFRFKLDQP